MPKTKSIYIFGVESESGKSVVLPDLMELLSRTIRKIIVI